ncbi:MAG: peptidoglycan DD-metalloendopeptidase family protein [Paludibacteraceae bacterium]|nr:peptidoglycan DD-metalloendopeptidase family protein [Paludibacteraceae bacterium]
MRRILLIVLAAILSCGICPAEESVKSLKKKQAELQKQMSTTNRMIQQTKKDQKATMNKLSLLNQNIKTQKQLISAIGQEIDALDQQIATNTKRRGELQKELERLKADYAQLIRESHYAQLQQQPLLYLISSENFQQLLKRVQFLQRFAETKSEQARRIQQTTARLNEKNSQLRANMSDKQTTMRAQQREQDNLARDERRQQAMLNQLKQQEKDLSAKLKAQQKKSEQLNSRISDLIRKQAEQQAKKGSMTKEQQLVQGDFEKNKGRLPWPIEKGHISGQFGKHKHPVHERVIVDNKGIYLQTPQGGDARAVYKGEVTSCFMMGQTYAVIIQHGNYRTVYAGLSKLYVKSGDKVETKQKIGRIYTDPEQDNKTELYFQIYKGRDILNPSVWISH